MVRTAFAGTTAEESKSSNAGNDAANVLVLLLLTGALDAAGDGDNPRGGENGDPVRWVALDDNDACDCCDFVVDGVDDGNEPQSSVG